MLNIVSGQEFIYYKEEFGIKGEIIPFNEAIIDGNPHSDIYSNEFIKERCKTYNVAECEYQKNTLFYINQIDLNKKLNLYFGFDMFCQINLLTLLAYLEQIGYKNKVNVYICDEIAHKVVDVFTTDVLGYMNLYLKIVVENKKIDTNNKYLNNVIEMYFDYLKKDKGVLEKLLISFKGNGRYEKLCYLITQDTVYGLGDVQWRKWLDECNL